MENRQIAKIKELKAGGRLCETALAMEIEDYVPGWAARPKYKLEKRTDLETLDMLEFFERNYAAHEKKKEKEKYQKLVDAGLAKEKEPEVEVKGKKPEPKAEKEKPTKAMLTIQNLLKLGRDKTG